MKERGLYIAVGLFLLAAIAYVTLDRNSSPKAVATPGPQPSPITGIKAADVKQVVVKTSAGILTIKPGATWSYSVCAVGADASTCPLLPADAVGAQGIVTAVVGLRPTRVVFGAPDGLPAYGLDSGTAGEIDITPNNGADLVLFVGGDAPDGTTKYVRAKDSNNIDLVLRTTLATILGAVAKPPVVPTPVPSAAPASPAVSPAAVIPSPSPS